MMRELLSSKSDLSMVRFMSLICIIAATIIACYGVYVGKDLSGLAVLVSAFITPAFAGKVIQRHLENK